MPHAIFCKHSHFWPKTRSQKLIHGHDEAEGHAVSSVDRYCSLHCRRVSFLAEHN